MKKALFLFLLGAIAGAIGFYYLQEQRHPKPATAPTTKADAKPEQPKTSLPDAAKAAVATQLSQWHLTPEDIRADLAQTGQVVRSKAHATGEAIAGATANLRTEATIKAKYALEKDLSARAIEVECHEGHVILRGTAATPALIGKAVALALDTDGVLDVKSQIAVATPPGE